MNTHREEHYSNITSIDILNAVDKSSTRSRKVLLLMIFSSILISIAVVNSIDQRLNWSLSRIDIYHNANNYLVFEDDSSSTKVKTIPSMKTFVDSSEGGRISKEICKMPFYDSTSYSILLRKVKIDSNIAVNDRYKQYSDIYRALKFMNSSKIFLRKEVESKLSAFSNSQLEHINLVKVPFLGVTFDINYLGIYSGLFFVVLYWLLFLSLKREHINTKIAFSYEFYNSKRHHYYFYEYMTMMQVLHMPHKLFEKKNKRYIIIQKITMFLLLCLPLLVYLGLVCNDWLSYEAGKRVNPFLTQFSLFIESIFLFSILGACLIVQRHWLKMDLLWDNQTIEYNLEYIFECLDIDKQKDLKPHDDKIGINESHLEVIKLLWLSCLIKIRLRKNNKPEESLSILSDFIDRTLGLEFDSLVEKYDESTVNKAWDNLIKWFNSQGKKSITDGYAKNFHDMCKGAEIQPTAKHLAE